jgi:membrane protease YdiL (CAAX protease family)
MSVDLPAPPGPGPASAPTYPPRWHPDPWRIAPLRWWDGTQWTPVLYGPYGEAWPLAAYLPPPFLPKGPGIKGGGIAAIGAGVGVAATVVVAIVFAAVQGSAFVADDPWYLLTSQLALWVGFLGAVFVASRKNGTTSLVRDYGLSWPTLPDLGSGFLGGLVARVLPTVIVVLIAIGDGRVRNPGTAPPTVLGISPSGTTGWVIVVVLAVIGAPVVEELFFRGLIQGAFTRRVGAVPAIFVTALIFATAHITSEGPSAPIILFPAGLILGYLRFRTGRLAAGMVAHATFNASLFLLLLVPAFR